MPISSPSNIHPRNAASRTIHFPVEVMPPTCPPPAAEGMSFTAPIPIASEAEVVPVLRRSVCFIALASLSSAG
jgi:hypothetical protein